jgi:hypothetical protein
MKTRPAHRYAEGVSLTEYVLPMALVVLVAIPVVMSTSQGMGKQIKVVFNDQAPPGSVLAATPVATGSPVPAPDPAADTPVSGNGVTITLSNGQKLTLGNYPMNMSELIETAGASGTTTALANLLMEYGKKMAEQGSITPEQGNLIQLLANKAHNMAAMQNAMEDHVQKMLADGSSTTTKYLSVTPITYNGVTYNESQDFVNLIDVMPGTDANGIQNAGSVMKDFYTLQKQLTDSGLNWNSPEGRFFQNLTQNIVYTVDGSANSWFAIDDATQWEANAAKSPLTTDQASKTTHGDAAGVCGVGSGQDTGVQCNPA